jgi:phage shock protein C
MPDTTEIKRLHKSRSDRMLDGVCGGIAEYFALDPTLVRIAWVLLTLLGGSGVILYIVAMIIMPAAPVTPMTVAQPRVSGNNSKFWGVLLVAVGLIWLLSNVGMPFWHHWWSLSWDAALAVLLILIGVAFLFGGRNYVSAQPPASPAPEAGSGATTLDGSMPPVVPVRRLRRSRHERKVFGVCGGLGDYFSIDPTIVRLLFVVAIIGSFGTAILAYFVMAILIPEEIIVPQMH